MTGNWVQETYLRVPAILPGNETNQGAEHASGVVTLLVQFQNSTHGLGREPDSETTLVCLNALVEVVESLGELAENLPLSSRLLVFHRLLTGLSHLGSPDGVDAKVFVENHEEVVKPSFTKTLVLELCIGVVRRIGL